MDIAKAEESLKAAELCYNAGLYNSAASRAYYAMFQAAQVALVLRHDDFDGFGFVMPAQAGIQFSCLISLDSRFRGNDTPLATPQNLPDRVLEKAGFKRPEWSHTALRAAFANELTRRRKFYSPFLARSLTLGLELRLVADYEEGEVSRKQAARGLRWAKEFIEQMKEGLSHG